MSGYLIDTDWIIDVLHGQKEATQTVASLSSEGVSISLISYGERYEGAYYDRDRPTALAELAGFVRGKVLLPPTAPIMERFGIARGGLSRQLRRQIGDMDLLIAATALTHDLTLLTRNLRDFEHVPDLKLYRPT